MNLSIRILDSTQESLVDIGHFQFFGNEINLDLKIQIVDIDNNSEAHYIPLSSTILINVPGKIGQIGKIEGNRSIVTTTFIATDIVNMFSGDMSVLISEPSDIKTAQLSNSVRRLTPFTGEGVGTGIFIDQRVKSDSDDTTAGFLEDEIVAGQGVFTEVVTQGGDRKFKIGVTSPDASVDQLTNNTGVTLEVGRVVRIVGTNQIDYADNTSINNAKIAGITLEEIADGTEGDVVTDGIITVGSISGVGEGDTLYLGDSDGRITSTPPSISGKIVQKIGRFNNGKIYLRFELVGIL